jgi:4-hydroxyphenylpyruvate dioxygenase-like putative hemolysin
VGNSPILITAVLALVASLAAIATARTNRRANAAQDNVALSAEARGWVAQAQTDAREAKNEAGEARREATEARREAHEAEVLLREVTAQTGSLLRWVERTVYAAHDSNVTDAQFRQMVNGGPPELSALRSRMPQ